MKFEYRVILIVTIILVLITAVGIPGLLRDYSNNHGSQEIADINVPSGIMEFTPNRHADLIYSPKTLEFINQTRNLRTNEGVSVEQIYYRLATIKLLDPALANLSSNLKTQWTSTLLSLQRSSGGFGHWSGDRSSISSTFMALQSLDWLDYNSLDPTVVRNYLDRLQNSITNGFNSHLLDRDSDVKATYYALKSYQLIGETPPNSAGVADYLRRAQNPDGGFGLQTNNLQNIYWTSKASVTQDAIFGLAILRENASNPDAALQFLRNLQLEISGGFANEITVTPIASSSYTAAALSTISLLNGTPVNSSKVIDYILSLEEANGGFRLKASSLDASLKGTYFSVLALTTLNQTPTDLDLSLGFLLNPPVYDGYGGTPGAAPTLRATFDAVYSQVLMDAYPVNPQGIIDFLASYRNPDGGYGLSGSFVESTLRVVETYNLLGIPFPESQETISFLQSQQLPNGGFSKTTNDTSAYVVSTYRAIRALELLSSQPSNPTSAISFLRGIQSGDGGFGGFLGDSSDVTNTYRAIRALNILGASPANPNSAATFLQNSQNLDGGFKRSSFDNARPKNASNIIHTYSAMRALDILGSYPSNMERLYNYTTEVRNFDGGYAEHPDFTSDNSYTFVSLYILRHLHEFSGFRVTIDDNLDSHRDQYERVSISIWGRLGHLRYSIVNSTTSAILEDGILETEGQVTLDTSVLPAGNYLLGIDVQDPSGAEIHGEFTVLIARNGILTMLSNPAVLALFLGVIGLLGYSRYSRSRKKG